MHNGALRDINVKRQSNPLPLKVCSIHFGTTAGVIRVKQKSKPHCFQKMTVDHLYGLFSILEWTVYSIWIYNYTIVVRFLLVSSSIPCLTIFLSSTAPGSLEYTVHARSVWLLCYLPPPPLSLCRTWRTDFSCVLTELETRRVWKSALWPNLSLFLSLCMGGVWTCR